MTSRARTLALVLMTATAAVAVGARAATPDPGPLEFHGFRPGASLGELETLVRSLDGRLRCDRAKSDRRITECRAVVNSPELGGSANLWISAVDSVASVITLSSGVGSDRLDRWRQTLERRYGRVDARVQGSQWMMQWVRRGRMLRLTWRAERGAKVASVSLIDGRVLDAWGKRRSR
ncbi:MAG: hypothetical protein H0T86_16500 [Gemmatimonadales bacterium]|nr:hypothetical protein [Gemmatimonadales bacterium]